MKSIYTLIFIFISFSVQSQVMENPGFEEWETLSNGNQEPVKWSSNQTADPANLANLAPQVLFKDSIDPHSGDYCIRLLNVYVSIANIVANGIATSGRVHADFNPALGYTHTSVSDPQWYTECTTRPDSIVGYYKYSPVDGDNCIAQAVLHTDTVGKIPDADSTNWVGMAKFVSPNETITEWTRFSAPFVYYNDEDPEYILFNLSGGNNLNAIAGSQAWYDDVELVYNPVGLDENVANALLKVYSSENTITIDMRKFGAGEVFELEVYSVSGKLIHNEQVISGYTKDISIETSGIYICKLQGKDGLQMAKKVFVQ
jgi:hypothetical protein